MNKSERYGCKFGLFPAWIEEYHLSHDEISELMKKSEPFLGVILQLTIDGKPVACTSCLAAQAMGRERFHCKKCGASWDVRPPSFGYTIDKLRRGFLGVRIGSCN